MKLVDCQGPCPHATPSAGAFSCHKEKPRHALHHGRARQQRTRSNVQAATTRQKTYRQQRQDRKRNSRNEMASIATPGSCRAEDDSRMLATREHALEAESTQCRSSTKYQSKMRSRSGLASRTDKQGLRTALRRRTDEQGLRIGVRRRANKQGSGSDGATSREHEGKQGSDIGSSNRTRTCDPMINSHLLYQLSYRGTTKYRSISGRYRS